MEYMRKITPEAEKFGICKIIPPDSWNPEFAIDTEVCSCRPPKNLSRRRVRELPQSPGACANDTQKFHFRTRKQELNSVEGSQYHPDASLPYVSV
jgi:histone demethylase JARID1